MNKKSFKKLFHEYLKENMKLERWQWAGLMMLITALTIVMTDEIYNLLASKFFNWPDAMKFYRSLGWKYLT